MKRSVQELIKQKRLHNFSSTSPDTSVHEALFALYNTNSSALLVLKNNTLVGIFSEKDFAKAALAGHVDLNGKVESIMTSKVYFAKPQFTLEECLQVMSHAHVRHLPVLDDSTPIALLSMRHIMEVLVEDKETEIKNLTTFITGSGLVQQDPMNIQTKISVPIYHTNSNKELL